MAKIELTNDQLRLVQKALDFYSRVGIGQFDQILDHPTYENRLRNSLRPKKDLEVGDRTERGEIVEIGEDYIKTKGSWGDGEEIRTWQDVENVRLSIDYGRYHQIRKDSLYQFNIGRNLLLRDQLHENSYYSIHSQDVDESCRVAFDIIQVIRHEFWKDSDRKSYTVDSSVNIWTSDGHKIKCKIDKSN